MSIVKQYKGNLSNFSLINTEIDNIKDELENVNRLLVTNDVTEDILKLIKEIRLVIFSITP